MVALAANIAVAVAKLAGGLLTGSAAMLSEAAHSVADSINELFLLTSLHRSARPADPRHPFGYGMERFFWSLLAAVGIFVAGAGFSALEAYRSFTSSAVPSAHYYLINYVIVAIAILAEGTSWVRAVRQLRAEARASEQSTVGRIRASTDPSVTTVASEDTAAIMGLLLAAAGLGLHQITGSSWWEGVSSALIAALLIVVAGALGRDSQSLLIGEAATPGLTDALRDYLNTECPAIDQLIDLMTMHIGANQVLLAVRVDLADGLSSADVERISSEIDAEIQQRWPVITEVFIDPTRARLRQRVEQRGRTTNSSAGLRVLR